MAHPEPGGFTLPEALLTLVLVGLLAQLGFSSASRDLAAARLEGASRRVMVGLERGRDAALRSGRPCALSLEATGWRDPQAGSLPACEGQAAAAAQRLARAGLLRVRVDAAANAANATIQLRLTHLPRRCGGGRSGPLPSHHPGPSR